jgi:hypothetical protein
MAGPMSLIGTSSDVPTLLAYVGYRSMRVFRILDPLRCIHETCLSALVTDRAIEAWYYPSMA